VLYVAKENFREITNALFFIFKFFFLSCWHTIGATQNITFIQVQPPAAGRSDLSSLLPRFTACMIWLLHRLKAPLALAYGTWILLLGWGKVYPIFLSINCTQFNAIEMNNWLWKLKFLINFNLYWGIIVFVCGFAKIRRIRIS
jgi:hypothetical protein